MHSLYTLNHPFGRGMPLESEEDQDNVLESDAWRWVVPYLAKPGSDPLQEMGWLSSSLARTKMQPRRQQGTNLAAG